MSDTKQPDSLDDLFDEYPQSLKPFKDNSPTAYAELKAAIQALQARAVYAELKKLNDLNNESRSTGAAILVADALYDRVAELHHLTSKKKKHD